jgi:hypothetical protein
MGRSRHLKKASVSLGVGLHSSSAPFPCCPLLVRAILIAPLGMTRPRDKFCSLLDPARANRTSGVLVKDMSGDPTYQALTGG